MVSSNRSLLSLRNAQIRWGARTYVMGIVNVTPDSFSGDGIEEPHGATGRAIAQWNAGADLLDLGGESTRPGHRPVTEEVEVARVIPVIEAVAAQIPRAPISVDTYKPTVARAARSAGAEIVNSVWGASDQLLAVVAELGMAIVAMHNQRGTAYDGPVMDAVLRYLDDCAARAVAHGIPLERIILDPGIGFGKTADQNIAVLRELARLVALGFATAAATALAVDAGIDVVRVHDVAATRDAIAVADAIVRDWRPASWIE